MVAERTDDGDPTCEEAHLTLVISHASAVPDDVSELLGIQPAQSHTVGDFVKTASGSRQLPSSQWELRSGDVVQSTDIHEHFGWLHHLIGAKSAELSDLQNRGWVSVVWLFWVPRLGHGGPELMAAELAFLGQIGASLRMDFYCTD